jgi:hypothetical protein
MPLIGEERSLGEPVPNEIREGFLERVFNVKALS